nr:hypothetical protein Iba_chr02eCG12140 [Ipomoea batatas]
MMFLASSPWKMCWKNFYRNPYLMKLMNTLMFTTELKSIYFHP